jgi:hypothetical protein
MFSTSAEIARASFANLKAVVTRRHSSDDPMLSHGRLELIRSYHDRAPVVTRADALGVSEDALKPTAA